MLFLSLFLAEQTQAAQAGPYFPTHHYPTDQSFLFSFRYYSLKTSNNYGEKGDSEELLNNGSVSRTRYQLLPQYQPNRRLSFGAFINIDKVHLDLGSQGEANKSGFSDQVIFSEYRVADEVGYSLGIAALVKFPLYSNPENNSGNTLPLALMGDAQTDFTLMGTSEFWAKRNLKLYADLGFTFRSDEHATEFPYQVGATLVKLKWELGLKFLGNFSMGNDKVFNANDDVAQLARELRTSFGNSNYAFAENPVLHKYNLNGLFWATPNLAFHADWEQTISGKNAPKFYQFSLGLSYRLAFQNRARSKTYKEVDIDTDQESGVFDGELQEK